MSLRVTSSKLVGSLILGASFLIGSQAKSIQAENKPEKPAVVNQEQELNKYYKQVETLKPNSKERKATLDSLQETAISQANAPNRNEIAKKLIQEMERNKTVENWQDLFPVVLNIVDNQYITNQEILGIDGYKEVLEPLSKCLLSTFATKTPDTKLQKEATNGIITLVQPPFEYKEPFLAFQDIKLKAISELPKDKAGQARRELQDLHRIYQDYAEDLARVSYDAYQKAAPYCEKIFKNNVELLLSNNLEEVTTAIDNLYFVGHLFDGHTWRTEFLEKVNPVKNDLPFFRDVLGKETTPRNIKDLELKIKASQVLLRLSRSRTAYMSEDMEHHKNYQSWLRKQVEDCINDNSQESKEKQKILEDSIEIEIFTGAAIPKYSTQSLNLLTESYIRLLNNNGSNLISLSREIDAFISLRKNSVVYNKMSPETKDRISEVLLTDIPNAVNQLPVSKEKRTLKNKLLILPAYFYGESTSKQDKLIEQFCNLYCKEPPNIEEFMTVLNSLLSKAHPPNVTRFESNWTPYTIHNFVANNLSYFEKNTKNLIELHEKEKNLDLKSSLRSNLIEVYKFFVRLQQSINLGIKTGNLTSYANLLPRELESVALKTNKYFKKTLERPLLEGVLSSLRNETVEVTKSRNGNLLVDNRSWRSLNNELKDLVKDLAKHQGEFGSQILSIVTNRLQQEENPYNREMAYQTLGIIPEANKKINPSILGLIKAGIVNEESSQAIRGIGKMLATTLHQDPKQDTQFRVMLESHLTQDKELSKEGLEQIPLLLVDLIKIMPGDLSLYKEYLPHCSFKADKDKKINPAELQAIRKLRENAFLALASLGSQHPDKNFYAIRIANILEKRFDRMGTSETLPMTWGKQAGALMNIYMTFPRSYSGNSIDSKLEFIKGRFFDGIEKTHYLEGERKTYTSLAFFNALVESEFIQLNPNTNRKFVDDLYNQNRTNEEIRERIFDEDRRESNKSKETKRPRLSAKYIQMRKEFGIGFINTLIGNSNTNINDCLDYLRQLGYLESEREGILKTYLP